jgi:hypothetical protein
MRTYKIAKGEFPEPSAMQKFGAPRDSSHRHEGIDLDLPNVDEFLVMAFEDGTIVPRKWNSQSGYSAWITHSNNTKSLYVHLTESSWKALKSRKVKAGEVFAVAGRTGNATGYVLHFELWINGRPVNPEPYILEQEDMAKTGKPWPSKGILITAGAPMLINNEGNKFGGKAGFEAEVPFRLMRTSKFGDMEFKSIFEDVWVHINDTKIIYWGDKPGEAEKKLEEARQTAKKLSQQLS